MKLELKITGHDKPTKLIMTKAKYTNGRLALLLKESETGEPWTILTVNIPHYPLAQDEFLVKGWSENAATVNALSRQTDLFINTGNICPAGFADAMVWKFADPKTLDLIPKDR